VTLGSGLKTAGLQQDACYTAELVGLALRETGSCPAEINLEAPTLAARSDKRRKQPFFYGALTAWALLFVCLGLYYYQQTVIAQSTARILRQKTEGLQGLAGPVNKLVAQSTTLQATLDAVVRLGAQRQAWPQILAALNEKIPAGVWITELTPSYESPTAGSGGPGRFGTGQENPAEINVLIINGLYHANPKTEQVDSARLGEFVNALAETPYFDIDPKKISDTLVSFTTAETDPASFAQKFSMHLKLKEPISLRP